MTTHLRSTLADDDIQGSELTGFRLTAVAAAFTAVDVDAVVAPAALSAETFVGSAGDDTFSVDDSGDVVVEAANGGTDTIYASISYTLPDNVERLILTGTSAINGTGNSLANELIGNDANNVLDGGAGNDTMSGGYGNDTYYANAYVKGNTTYLDAVFEGLNQGHDTMLVSVEYFMMPANVEDLVLLGHVRKGTGNSENNRITGNAEFNEIDGGGGSDTMIGGAGSDTYAVSDLGDVVVELADGGIDSIRTDMSYVLPANVEGLFLLGSGNINATGNGEDNDINGTSGSNVLAGGAGNDTVSYRWAAQGVVVNLSVTAAQSTNWGTDTITGFENVIGGDYADKLTGTAGANFIDGGWGNDTMTGGLGNDTYEVDDLGDVVVEAAGGGVDRILSLYDYTLGSTLENLTLRESTAALNGTGNSAANDIVGNSRNNVLDGRGGADTMTGGLGADTYSVDNANDKTIEDADGGTDLVQSSVSFALQAEVENLTLTGSAQNGTGNGLPNILTGNAAANVLDGGAGYDTMYGGAGNDTYIVDTVYDLAVELAGGGIDLVKAYTFAGLPDEAENLILMGNASIDASGNALANVMTGNTAVNTIYGADGNDTIDGGGGADVLQGGEGNDTFIVDNLGVQVVEFFGDGTDLVKSSISITLQDEVENLTLTGLAALNGTGNTLPNVIVGNAGANVLNGGTGADSMTGGSGGDTYVVDNLADQTIEAVAGGLDMVRASITWTLGSEVENLTLTGSNVIDAIGNTKNNLLIGNAAANTLDGGAGADTMTGGSGSDTYVVDNAGDQTSELVAGGLDTVKAAISWTLGSEVENLTLMGSSAIRATGNTKNNVLVGNAAANTLNGSAGADTMSGGSGSDTYVVDNAGDRTNELVGSGLDAVLASVSWTLSTEVENLTLTGAGAISANGNTKNNVLNGNGAANTLDGGAGADTLTGGAGADTFDFGSTLGSDTITDFAHNGDKIRLSQSTLRVGDGDTVIEGAASIAGPNGFSTAAELVIVTHDIAGDITATSAAAAIGKASSSYAAGNTRLFVVDNGHDSAVYLFKSLDNSATVTANELTLVATLEGTGATSSNDYLFGA